MRNFFEKVLHFRLLFVYLHCKTNEQTFNTHTKMANYIQNFNISEMAKALGMNPGEKREYNINVDGTYYGYGYKYLPCTIKKIRITKAKNGHTTLKIWGIFNAATENEDTNKWYAENIIEKNWWLAHPDTLLKVQNEILS